MSEKLTGGTLHVEPHDDPKAIVMQINHNFGRVRTELDRIQGLRSSAASYTLSNTTANRTIDPSTATLADIANALATLISDLKNNGIVR